ncbi:hypothetical protein D5018_09490 [Parashewanella curva]|uniref:Orphan protein n=1 Tax=Parashewanella curva TaxID=2338552 RepID=A0A3L8PX02_9GAMM|nr:hypothetical protein [Parashewanella curva]RLV59906.1 hypothetical protein D5018_09490 [Parashewanella curva]
MKQLTTLFGIIALGFSATSFANDIPETAIDTNQLHQDIKVDLNHSMDNLFTDLMDESSSAILIAKVEKKQQTDESTSEE